MKIPSARIARPVQSLGRQDIAGPMRVAQAEVQRANTVGAGFEAMGQLAKEVGLHFETARRKKAEHEADIALTAARRALQDVEGDVLMGGTYNIDELPTSASLPLKQSTLVAQPDGTTDSASINTVDRSLVAVEVFDARAEAIGKSLGDKVSDPEIAQKLSSAWNRHVLSRRQGVVTRSASQQRKAMQDQALAAATQLAETGAIREAEELLNRRTGERVGEGLFNPVETRANIESLREVAEVRAVEAAMASGDLAALEQAEAIYADPDYPGSLEANERNSLLKSIRAHIDRTKQRVALDIVNANAKEVSDLEVGIANGTAGPAVRMQVEQLFERNALGATPKANANKRTQLLKAIDQQERRAAAARQSRADYLINKTHELPINLRDKGQRKQLELDLKSIDVSTPEGQGEYARTLNWAKALPDSERNVLEQLARSDKPEHLQLGYRKYRTIRGITNQPQLLERLDENAQNFYSFIDHQVEAGVSTTDAINMAVRRRSEPRDEQRYRAAWSEVTKAQDPREVLQQLIEADDDPGFFGEDPQVLDPRSVPPEMVSDFIEQTRTHFTYGDATRGDYAASAYTAYQNLRTQWRTERVNERPQLMRHGPGLTTGYDADALRADLGRQATVWSERGIEFSNVDNLQVRPHPNTSDMRPERRSYYVFDVDPDTGLSTPVLTENGLMLEYVPLPSMAVEQRRQDELAREQREAERERFRERYEEERAPKSQFDEALGG